MTDYILLLWLAGIFRDISVIATIIFIITGTAASIFLGFIYSEEYTEEMKNNLLKWVKRGFIVSSCSLLLSVIIPSEKVMNLYVASKVVEDGIEYIKQDKELSKLPKNVVKYLNDFFEKELQKDEQSGQDR